MNIWVVALIILLQSCQHRNRLVGCSSIIQIYQPVPIHILHYKSHTNSISSQFLPNTKSPTQQFSCRALPRRLHMIFKGNSTPYLKKRLDISSKGWPSLWKAATESFNLCNSKTNFVDITDNIQLRTTEGNLPGIQTSKDRPQETLSFLLS